MEAFPFSDQELGDVGLTGDGVSQLAQSVINTMKEHPGLLQLPIFALQCLNNTEGRRNDALGLESSSESHRSISSVMAESTTTAAPYAPDEYERTTFYNGITTDGDHPILIYRSDYSSTPFPRPSGRFATIPVKTLRGVFGTPLNKQWTVVGPLICDVLKGAGLRGWSIDPARFFTLSDLDGEEKGTLGPVVIWIGVKPGSTSPDLAHKIAHNILDLLHQHNIDDVVVQFREAQTRQLAATPTPLLAPVDVDNPTHDVRQFLTTHLGVPLTTQDQAYNQLDGQGTLTLWFHENKDKDGNPSDRVLGLTCCHVLRRTTTTTYKFHRSAPRNDVCVCGARRFQRGLDNIMDVTADHTVIADVCTRRIANLQAIDKPDDETKGKLQHYMWKLEEAKNAIRDLEALYHQVTNDWSDIKSQRNIGLVEYAPAVSVAKDTQYTLDWGVFVADEAKVRPHFEGNVVDLGTKYSSRELTEMFRPAPGGPIAFRYPEERTLRIVGCLSEDEIAHPIESDADGQPCLMVGKVGNSTGLTVGRYSGMVSFLENETGVVSRELGIYNTGPKNRVQLFSNKGDSGSLIWHSHNGQTRMVGMLHSGRNAGASTSDHITYATPMWYVLEQVKTKYSHADFYCHAW